MWHLSQMFQKILSALLRSHGDQKEPFDDGKHRSWHHTIFISHWDHYFSVFRKRVNIWDNMSQIFILVAKRPVMSGIWFESCSTMYGWSIRAFSEPYGHHLVVLVISVTSCPNSYGVVARVEAIFRHYHFSGWLYPSWYFVFCIIMQKNARFTTLGGENTKLPVCHRWQVLQTQHGVVVIASGRRDVASDPWSMSGWSQRIRDTIADGFFRWFRTSLKYHIKCHRY